MEILMKYLLIAALLFVVGCATTPDLNQLYSLKPGISEQALVNDFGQPDGSSFIDGKRVLTYWVYNNSGMNYHEYLFYFDENNLLTGWHDRPDTSQNQTSIGVVVPVPPMTR